MTIDLNYNIGYNLITYDIFIEFINKVDKDFIPPLLNRIDSKKYYEKLDKNAILSICKCDKTIVGLVAGYCNNIIDKKAYITLVATDKEYRNHGIARLLIMEFIKYSRSVGMKTINIDTNNEIAYNLYLSIGFKLMSKENCFQNNIIRYYLEINL